MSNVWPPQFLFASCQCGAESALKHEVSKGPHKLRPAFSRPGFVTFKIGKPVQHSEQFQLPATFARCWGFSLGKVQGEFLAELARQAWQLSGVEEFLATEQIADLHVWQRDSAVPGERGFAPGPTCLALEAEQALRSCAPHERLREMPINPRPPSKRNRWVLDVVLVEPGEWWLGCHRTLRRHDCWPGGVPPLKLPEHAVSRAYLKMQEALEWSAVPFSRGDLCVELGCAPGGASQALVEQGLRVLGVDPAEVAPEVLALSNFTHLRHRSLHVPRKQLRGAKWLAVDINAAPNYTLDAAEQVVVSDLTNIRGMILTLKLADWKLAERLPKLLQRVRSWGYRDIRTRQLAFNRQEICLVALRSRAQRRMRRAARHQTRKDAPHASAARRPHFSSPIQ
ncbi:MAG: hypothetical protein MI725_08790 [Pirellulales bacterium]|nr:hypothetical protein [Pirellulales bacterium]